MILEGGTDPHNIAALANAARDSYEMHLAGGQPEPIFLVEPGATGVEEVTPRPGTAFILRTSGSTTGTGKLVELPWESILASGTATNDTLGGPGRWLTSLPVHHIAGLQTVLRSVTAGHSPHPYRVGDPIPDGRNYLSLVPTQLTRALQDPSIVSELASVAAILVGGQATPQALLHRGREAGLNLVTTYGMTETCGGCVYDGKPIGNTRVDIDSGRIIIHSPVVTLGYVGGEVFNGRFETSDAGTFTDNTLTVLGRLDDAITTGGMTIMPSLLEDFVATTFNLTSVATSVPDPDWGEKLILVTETEVDLERLRGPVKERLGAEYAPKELLTLADLGLESFPLKDSGKLDRRALARLVKGQ